MSDRFDNIMSVAFKEASTGMSELDAYEDLEDWYEGQRMRLQALRDGEERKEQEGV